MKRLIDGKGASDVIAAGDKCFKEGILEILGEITQTGSFKKTVTMKSGEVVTYEFSLAVGWGSSFREGEYERHFSQSLPKWVQLRHPYHISNLCQLALRHGQPLPKRHPINKIRISNV
jgi:hypothetical protein